MNFKRCRACLNNSSEVYDIFSNVDIDENVLEIASVMRSIANIQVEKTDSFPKAICATCLNRLKQSYYFKIQCEDSYTKLLDNSDYLKDVSIDYSESLNIAQMEYKTALNKLRTCNEIELIKAHNVVDKSVEKIQIINMTNADFEALNVLPESIKLKLEELGALHENKGEFTSDALLLNTKAICVNENTILTKFSEDEENVIFIMDYRKLNRKEHKLRKKKARSNRKQYTCPVCSKACNSKTHLSTHIVSHQTEKSIPCPHENCEFKFKLKHQLRRHMLRHTNLRDHLCSVCGKAYNTRDSLWTHMQYHAKNAPYQCTFCGKQYFLGSHLKSHLYTHTGKPRKYTCENCGRSYRTIEALRSHREKYCDIGLKPRFRFSKKEKETIAS